MRVSINQPAYLPWLGYFHRIAISDLHIVLDHVQFEKNSFTNRNRIRTKTGWSWLTVPLNTSGKFGELPIAEVEISNQRAWGNKHWESIRLSYSKAKYFGEHARFFEDLYAREWTTLKPLLDKTTAYLLDAFAIRTLTRFSSEMSPVGSKAELVLNLCRQVGATHYISGPLGRNYLDEKAFRDAGIAVTYHDYGHPVYSQAYSGFEANMSAIDLLMNHGPQSASILMREAPGSGDTPRENVVLRPATASDGRLIFGWRNMPFIVSRGSSQTAVSWEEHETWFTNSLRDPAQRIFVVEVEGEPAGQVRFDRNADQAVITVYLIERFTGKGHGLIAIKQGCRRISGEWGVKGITACVRMENAAARSSFLKAAFHEIDSKIAGCPPNHAAYRLNL